MLIHFLNFPEELLQEKIILLDILDASRDFNLPNKPKHEKTEQAKESIKELKQSRKDRNIDSVKQEQTKDIEQKAKEMECSKEQKPIERKSKELKPVEQQKSTKSKSKVGKKNEKKQSESELSNSILKSLKSSTTKKKTKNIYDDIKEVNQAIKSHSKKKYNKQRTITASQEAAIRSHVQKFWYIAPFSGATRANDIMRVRVIVSLNAKGEVISVKTFADAGTRNKNYQAFLESATRAVLDASPFPGLHKEQYDIWQYMEFTFDSSNMLQ